MPHKKTYTKKKLNENEVAFCYEYVANNFNGAQAYNKTHRSGSLRASSVMASRLLGKPNIKAKIKKLTEEHLTTLNYNANSVLKELSKNAFSDVRDFVRWNKEEGVIIKDSEELGEFASCIKEIDIDAREITVDGEPSGVKDYKIKCKLHDKTKALELLGKNLMLFADKIKLETDETTEKFKQITEFLTQINRPSSNKPDNENTA